MVIDCYVCTDHSLEEPKACLMVESTSGIDEKENHDDEKHKRVCVRWNAQGRAVKKAQDAQCPNHAKHSSELHDVLFREVIPWVQFENEYMVDT